MIFYIIPIIILMAILAWLKTPMGIGAVGEWRIKLALGRNKEHEKYVINNIMIAGENGCTSQIDHILINPNGVFVIETKNYAGRIYGQENQLEWTQVLAGGRVKNKLYNPVKQNATHLYKVKELLDDNISVRSIVVFVRGNIKNVNAKYVYTVAEMKSYISMPTKNQLTAEQIDKTYKILNRAKQKKIKKKEHIKNIRTLQKNIANNICPRCGAQLVLRNGKNGKFYGCSKFPKCKFTKDAVERYTIDKLKK